MCGIAAIINKSLASGHESLVCFTNAVAHRGPDSVDFAFFDSNLNRVDLTTSSYYVGLGHRRLSILDLSEAGNQPMSINDGDYTITYNGEIYNYLEIRRELEQYGFSFKSSCDTEVLLAAYAKWGSKCLSKLNGMWSFVILDRKKQILFISRDRVGIKPMYYYSKGANLAIASEIKQFFTLPNFKKRINTDNLILYLATGYEDPPSTFYEDIYAFPPGSFAEVQIESPSVNPIKFWDGNTKGKMLEDIDEIIPMISQTFSESVRLHLRSDVPVGVCFSGGLDSSSILVSMEKISEGSSFSAFSACFNDQCFDERPFMNMVLKDGNYRHFQVFPDEKSFISNFDHFIKQHDEPVGSVSMFAQYMVMKSARENGVPVLLDGQGGDELLSGYWSSYMLLLNNLVRKHPLRFSKHFIQSLLPVGNRSLCYEAIKSLREFKKRSSESFLPFTIKEDMKDKFNEIELSKWHLEAQKLSPDEYRKAEIFKIHLPRLLKWEDRNSMAFSIESRLPFLDANFLSLMLSIPSTCNLRAGWTKYLFRKAMQDSLPKEICWRRDKMGFDTPQQEWMKKGPIYAKLLDWAIEIDHPILEFIDADFSQICLDIQNENFDSNAMFRLFCADRWLKTI